MLAAGIGPGDVVLLRLPSDSAYVVAYAAAAKVGAITAGVNPRLAEPEQQAVAAVAGGALTLAAADEVDGLRRPARGAARRRCRPARRPRVHVGHDGPAEGRAVPRPAARGGHPHRRRAMPGATPPAPPTSDARQHAVRPRRLHDQAAVVPAPRDHHPHPRALAGRRHAGVGRRAPHHDARRRRPADGAAAPRGPRRVRPQQPGGAHRRCCRVSAGPGPGGQRAPRAGYSIRYSSTESGGCGTGTAFDADDEEALFTVGKPRGGIEVGICDDDAGPLPDGEVGRCGCAPPP